MVLSEISHFWFGFVLYVVSVKKRELLFCGSWELEHSANETFAQVSFEG